MDTSCLPKLWEDYEDDPRGDAARQMAEAVLTDLTLGRVGGCPITIRPCVQRPAGRPQQRWTYGGSTSMGGFMVPYQDVDGQIRNYVPCQGGDCEGNCEIDLGTVIGRVDEIKVDGQALDIDGKLAVIDGHILAWRGDEPCPFPKSQNLSLADTEPGTWSITYLPAHEVDQAGQRALAMLTFEFAKAICNAEGCRLPANVTQVVRQGVSISIRPGLFSGGETGIREVDVWVKSWNPHGAKRRTAVFGPLTPQHRTERTVTTL